MSIREDIKAYIDGELTKERAAEVASAIAADPSLRAEFEAMAALGASIKSLNREPIVVGADKAMRVSRFSHRPWMTVLVGTGSIAALALVIVPLLAQSDALIARKGSGAPASSAAPGPMTSKGTVGDFGVDGLAPNAEIDVPQSGGFDSNSFGNVRPPSEQTTEAAKVGSAENTSKPEVGVTVSPESDQDNLSFVDARLVIKNASFGIEVDDVQESMDKTTHLTKAMGGFIESSNKSETEGKGRGYMTIRVPQDKFESTVEQLKDLGEVKSETANGDDVTAQVADIDARIRTLKSEEESYREILRQARRISDILDIRERISQVRQEIESLTAQQATLRRLAALATINLEFREAKKTTDEPKPDDWFDETNTSAVVLLKSVGKFFAQIGIYVFNLAPIWVPVAGLAWWLKRRLSLAGPTN